MYKNYKKTILLFLLIFTTESFCYAWFNSIKKYYYENPLIVQQTVSSKFFYLAAICIGILAFSYTYMKKTVTKHNKNKKNSINQSNNSIKLYVNNQEYLLEKSILKKGSELAEKIQYDKKPESIFSKKEVSDIEKHFLTLSANEFLTQYNEYFFNKKRTIPFIELDYINNILVSCKLHDHVMNNDVLKNRRELFSFTYLYDTYNWDFSNKDFQKNCKSGMTIDIKKLHDLQLCTLLIVNSSQKNLPGMTSLCRPNLKKIFLNNKNYNLTREEITNELQERLKQVNQEHYVIRV